MAAAIASLPLFHSPPTFLFFISFVVSFVAGVFAEIYKIFIVNTLYLCLAWLYGTVDVRSLCLTSQLLFFLPGHTGVCLGIEWTYVSRVYTVYGGFDGSVIFVPDLLTAFLLFPFDRNRTFPLFIYLFVVGDDDKRTHSIL